MAEQGAFGLSMAQGHNKEDCSEALKCMSRTTNPKHTHSHNTLFTALTLAVICTQGRVQQDYLL